MQLSKGIVTDSGGIETIEEGDVLVYHECEALSIGDTVIVPMKAIIAYERERE